MRKTTLISTILCLTLLIFISNLQAKISAPWYIFTDLGVMGKDNSTKAVAINNTGKIIVRNYIDSYVWIPNKPNGTTGKLKNLGYGKPGSPTDEWPPLTEAEDINDKGEVAGSTGIALTLTSGAWPAESFRTHPNGSVKDAVKLQPTFAYGWAKAINNRGDVVGSSGSYTLHASLWKQGTSKGQKLGKLRPDDMICEALDINDQGVIVGYSVSYEADHSNIHAFQWSKGKMKDIGEGSANAINTQGWIAGESGDKACLWINGKRRFLTTPGKEQSVAFDINKAGRVVGEAGNAKTNSTHAILWVDKKSYDLNDLTNVPNGWILQSAEALNDKGQIVGYYKSEDGKFKAFLLTPK